jgi:hypothetical protein
LSVYALAEPFPGERQISPGDVLRTNQTVFFVSDNVTINGLVLAQCFVQSGDSGGPVFTVDQSGNVTDAGTLTGSSGNSECYYTPTNEIASSYGGAAY